MSHKPTERSDEPTRDDEVTITEGTTAAERVARKPVVPRGLGLAGDTVRPPEPVVSFGEAEPLPAFEQDRETLPPPIPMEQLVEQMMKPDGELAGARPDEDAARLAVSETIPPPASDVDTVRPRGDDAKTIPPRGDDTEPGRTFEAPTIPPTGDTDPPRQDDVATLPPPGNDADTLPPTPGSDIGEGDPLYRELAAREPSPTLSTRARETAEAVFEELGVELFQDRARDTVEEPSRPAEELPRSRPVEDLPRSRPEETLRSRTPDEPPRIATPPRTVRPALDAPPPPSSTIGRPGSHRRRPSEPGTMSRVEPPTSGERISPAITAAPVSDRLNEVRARYEASDHRGALALAESILAETPGHIAALSYAESSRQMLKQKFLARIGDTSVIPRLLVSDEELARHELDERAHRVVEVIDGVRTIDDIFGVAGVPTIDVLRVVHDLLLAQALELSAYPRGRR